MASCGSALCGGRKGVGATEEDITSGSAVPRRRHQSKLNLSHLCDAPNDVGRGSLAGAGRGCVPDLKLGWLVVVGRAEFPIRNLGPAIQRILADSTTTTVTAADYQRRA